jgi:hypothetical protein
VESSRYRLACSLERALGALGQHTRHPVTGVYSNKVADAVFVHFDSLHITHSLTHPHIFTVSCLDCLKHSQTLSYRAIPQPGRAKQSYRHPSKALTHSSTPAAPAAQSRVPVSSLILCSSTYPRPSRSNSLPKKAHLYSNNKAPPISSTRPISADR